MRGARLSLASAWLLAVAPLLVGCSRGEEAPDTGDGHSPVASEEVPGPGDDQPNPSAPTAETRPDSEFFTSLAEQTEDGVRLANIVELALPVGLSVESGEVDEGVENDDRYLVWRGDVAGADGEVAAETVTELMAGLRDELLERAQAMGAIFALDNQLVPTQAAEEAVEPLGEHGSFRFRYEFQEDIYPEPRGHYGSLRATILREGEDRWQLTIRVEEGFTR